MEVERLEQAVARSVSFFDGRDRSLGMVMKNLNARRRRESPDRFRAGSRAGAGRANDIRRAADAFDPSAQIRPLTCSRCGNAGLPVLNQDRAIVDEQRARLAPATDGDQNVCRPTSEVDWYVSQHAPGDRVTRFALGRYHLSIILNSSSEPTCTKDRMHDCRTAWLCPGFALIRWPLQRC